MGCARNRHRPVGEIRRRGKSTSKLHRAIMLSTKTSRGHDATIPPNHLTRRGISVHFFTFWGLKIDPKVTEILRNPPQNAPGSLPRASLSNFEYFFLPFSWPQKAPPKGPQITPNAAKSLWEINFFLRRLLVSILERFKKMVPSNFNRFRDPPDL